MRKSHQALELSLGHPLLISSYFKLLHQDPAKTKSAASDDRQQCGTVTSAVSVPAVVKIPTENHLNRL